MWSSIVLIFFLIFFFYKRKVVLYLPVTIFVLFYSIVIILTLFYHFYCPSYYKFNLYGFDFIGQNRFYNTMDVFTSMIISFIFGTFLFSILNKEKSNLKIKKNDLLKGFSFNIKGLTTIIIILLVIGLLLVFVDFGNELFFRTKYIPTNSSSFKTIYQILFIIISFFTGLNYFKKKFFSLVTMFVLVLIGISIGSRFASIYLIIFGISFFITLKQRIRKVFFLTWFTPFIIIFFGFNISLRAESNSHGLIPYLSVVFNKPEVIYEYTLKNIYYTLVFGFYATADTLNVYTFDSPDKLITCLNPLPGKLTNWYSLAKRMRSNIFAPFTAIGELARYKYFFYFYFITVGYYFRYVEYFIIKSFNSKKYIFPILHILLLIMFIIFSFEYNLRSSNRFIYYSFFLFIISYILKITYSRQINNRKNA